MLKTIAITFVKFSAGYTRTIYRAMTKAAEKVEVLAQNPRLQDEVVGFCRRFRKSIEMYSELNDLVEQDHVELINEHGVVRGFIEGQKLGVQRGYEMGTRLGEELRQNLEHAYLTRGPLKGYSVYSA